MLINKKFTYNLMKENLLMNENGFIKRPAPIFAPTQF